MIPGSPARKPVAYDPGMPSPPPSPSSPDPIRPLAAGEGPACEAILRSLPEWFGIEESIREYARDVETMETVVAADGDEITGFLTLRHHSPHSAEIQVMGVRPDRRRSGVGRALVDHAKRLLEKRSVRLFQVKTLGPSRESESYAGTRAFYERLGFAPLEENGLWGDANPCLIMVMPLGGANPASPRRAAKRGVKRGRDVINLRDKLASLTEPWAPRIVAELNDYQFKIARLEGEFVWHSHEDTDEAFLLLDGELTIELRDGSVDLREGEMYVVPAGVEHRPVAAGECCVLLVEPRGVMNTGEAGGDLTAENDVWL